MIRLFTSFYCESNRDRQNELLECLRRNLENRRVQQVCLFLENVEAPLAHSKLLTKTISHRPWYRDLFNWVRELQTDTDDISIVCNSDIYFDQSIAALAYGLRPQECIALSRWDVTCDGSAELFYRNDSQDTWVFRGHIRPVVDDFPIGVARCDNRMLHELRQAGYKVLNPAFAIKSFHLHAEQARTYDDDPSFVDPPYAYIWPENFRSLPITLLHNLLRPGARIGWSIDWRRISGFLPVHLRRKLPRLSLFPNRKLRSPAKGKA